MKHLLLADIGGTYARFAILSGNKVGPTWATEVRSRNTVVEAIGDFLAAGGGGAPLEGALLAVAGPVEGGRCRLTNAAWTIDEAEIAQALVLPWVRIVNDLEAIAAGLPDIDRSQTRSIGHEHGIPGAPMAILAPGTGLGMACVIAGPKGRCVVPSEGGHASLAAFDAQSDRLIAQLRKRFEHVSTERVLSGEGLVNLYQAIGAMEGLQLPRLTPVDVTTAAFDGSSALCRSAVDMFCSFLGAVAGDFALMCGARGGVYIGGGIVPRFVDHLSRSAFRRQFEAKGRLTSYLSTIPTHVILHANPAFVGLMGMAKELR